MNSLNEDIYNFSLKKYVDHKLLPWMKNQKAYQFKYFSRVVANVDLGTAPITVSFFSPFLKTMTVGMLRIPYSVAMPGLSSVFSFKHLTWPAYVFASSSISGAIMRQGPHHGAQKSTRTGILLSSTSSFHVASLTTPATEGHERVGIVVQCTNQSNIVVSKQGAHQNWVPDWNNKQKSINEILKYTLEQIICHTTHLHFYKKIRRS